MCTRLPCKITCQIIIKTDYAKHVAIRHLINLCNITLAHNTKLCKTTYSMQFL